MNRTRNDREDKAWNDCGHKLIAFIYNKTRSHKKLAHVFFFFKAKLLLDKMGSGNLPSGY